MCMGLRGTPGYADKTIPNILNMVEGQTVQFAGHTLAPWLRRHMTVIACLALIATALSVIFVTAAPRGKAGAQLNVPSISTPQLLSNPDFGQNLSHWNLDAGANWAVYQGYGVVEDGQFLETNTGSAGAGASVYQDVSTTAALGHSYRGSMLLRSPANVSVPVRLALWALGGSSGSLVGVTNATLTSNSWQRVSVDTDITNSGYTNLRLQLYVDATGINVDVDGPMLQDAGLGNASFEQGTTNWGITPNAAWAVYPTSANESTNFLEWNWGNAGYGSSISQDVTTQPTNGEDYQAAMMLRSPSGTPITVQLVLWALGGSSADESGVTTTTVSSTSWQPVGVTLHVGAGGFTDLRVQLYSYTSANLDVDTTSLTDAGLSNSNFENNFNGWSASPAGMAYAVYNTSQAYEDNTLLEMNTGNQTSGTVQTSANFSVTPGAYNAYVALRSPASVPANVHLRLFTNGGKTEVALSSFTVSSSNWALYSVELDVANTGHTGLSFRVGIVNSGVNLDVGAANLVYSHGSPVSATSGDCTPSNSCSPVTFSDALLAEPQINGPATGPNVYALEVWDEAEGGGAGCPGQPPNTAPWAYSSGPAGNPINTTQSNAGSQPTTWNSVGVQQFQDAAGHTCWYWGLAATYQTLINGYYGAIISALQNPASTNNAQCVALAQAVGSTPWGTGNFSGDCNNTVSAT
jgi:hypothetical protein